MHTPRPGTVFVVDDSPYIRARIVEMLAASEGLVLVGEAACAREAIAGIVRTRPAAVLLDLNLGGPTGLDVLRSVRAQVPQTVFVVLSNHSEPQYREACAAAGAEYFLDKSTEFERVPGVLARIAPLH